MPPTPVSSSAIIPLSLSKLADRWEGEPSTLSLLQEVARIGMLSCFCYLSAELLALSVITALLHCMHWWSAERLLLLQEVALIGMLGYLSYLSGELLGLSGIVTLFCCAVAISHYALHNISAPARVTLVRSCQTLSYVSEGAIFIYVGMDTLDPLKWKVRSFLPPMAIWHGSRCCAACADMPCCAHKTSLSAYLCSSRFAASQI